MISFLFANVLLIQLFHGVKTLKSTLKIFYLKFTHPVIIGGTLWGCSLHSKVVRFVNPSGIFGTIKK